MSVITLSGVTWDHPRGYDCVVAASRLYEQETGIRIEWTKRSLQAFADEPIIDLAKANDFIVLDHPHVGQISESGALLPLSPPADPNESLGGSSESYFWNGQCWSYAIDASCQMAVHRTDINAPVPTHWEQFLEKDASQFKALTPLLPVDAFDMLMTLVAGRGEERLPYNEGEFISTANGLPALMLLKALYKLGPEEACDWNPIKVLEILSSSDEFACSPCLFGYINYVRPGFREKSLSYFDLPLWQNHVKRSGILGGAGIGVSSKTKYPWECKKFAQWISSEAVQSGIYLQNEGQPANRKTWLTCQDNPKYEGFFKGAFNTIDNAWTRPRDDWFLHYVDEVCEIFPVFFRKDINEEKFLLQLNALYRSHVR